MANKNLDDIELVVSPLTGEVYIGQVKIDKNGNKLSENKKNITQAFKNSMMMFFNLNEKEREQESMAGSIKFTPKNNSIKQGF